MSTKNYTFNVTIQHGRSGGAFVEIPLDVYNEFGTNGRVKVKATFDDVEYRGSIMPMGGIHILGITKAIRSQIGKDVGDAVHVVVSEDLDERVVEVPDALATALDSAPEARVKFDNLAYTYRKEFAKWITDARKIETRERRLKKAISMIINGEKL